MPQLPVNRTTSNTAAEHVSDHNILHALNNLFDGTSPSTFALATHNHSAAQVTSGIILPARLGSGTADSTTFLRGDSTYATPAGVATTDTMFFSFPGTLSVGTGVFRLPVFGNRTLRRIEAICPVGNGPTGANLIFDVNIWNGSSSATVWPTQSQRIQIAAGGVAASTTTIGTTSVLDTRYISVDVDQIGSTVSGRDCIVAIHHDAA